MSKDTSQSGQPTTKRHDEVVATVLSMTLEKRAKPPRYRVAANPPANTADDVEDLWDNVPV